MSRAVSVTPFGSLGEVRDLVRRFEAFEIPREDWDHRAHLAVAMWYLANHAEDTATGLFIDNLRRFNHAAGISGARRGGYNETLTLFGLSVGQRIRKHRPEARTLELVNLYLRMPRSLASLCYPDRVLWSREARCRWLAPSPDSLEELDGKIRELIAEASDDSATNPRRGAPGT